MQYWKKYFLTVVVIGIPLALTGCLSDFAANQARRQAARSADHYVRRYVEPEIAESYAGDPQAQAEFRDSFNAARNELADTIVTTGNERYQTGVGVDDRGWLTKEKR